MDPNFDRFSIQVARALNRIRDRDIDRKTQLSWETDPTRQFRYPDRLWDAERRHENFGRAFMYERAVQHGIVVKTQVKWDVPVWTPRSQVDSRNPLLVISMRPLEDEGWHFPYTRPREPLDDEWHFSIIHKNEFDTNYTPDHQEALLAHLTKHFQNKRLHLHFRPPVGDEGTPETATGLQMDERRDPIASDPIVRRLRETPGNRHATRPYHITI